MNDENLSNLFVSKQKIKIEKLFALHKYLFYLTIQNLPFQKKKDFIFLQQKIGKLSLSLSLYVIF